VARTMDEKMESYGELMSTGERTTVASAIVAGRFKWKRTSSDLSLC
jgi:hypothetical protein